MDFLKALESDHHRMIEVGAGSLQDRVPTCPEWTVDDLLAHVAMVYLHKVESMRHNAAPAPWPPAPTGESGPEILRRAYADLTAEFAARPTEMPAAGWFEPDQTVGFWQRRMAQETVIHRIDAELAAGAASLTVPDDLAIDGIDEVLKVFLSWPSRRWPEEFTDELSKGDGEIGVSTGGRAWLVRWDADGVDVLDDAERPGISGTPDHLLRWLWRRAGDEVITVDGVDRSQVAQLRALLGPATQ